ncbi:MAG TPA: thiamine pyrophosphate-binding protein [Candidatus Binatia bacterium]|nr:thiamine pyrophosphate-binding protein [Candidatus Binatia bacterium]
MTAAVDVATGHARADQLVDALRNAGIDFFTGVPCSLVGPVIAALEPLGYVAETREDAALGLAAGAALAGRRPLVLMQNSGFGVSLNALGSLQILYELPCLLLVTWRGRGGKDAPEHLVMGRAMPAILDAIGIPWRELGADAIAADVAWARARLDAAPGAVALVVPPGLFA